MKVALVGLMSNNTLSPMTVKSLHKLHKLYTINNDLQVDLLLLSDKTENKTICLPFRVNTIVYDKVTGNDETDKYKHIIENYYDQYNPEHIVISADHLIDNLVPMIGSKLNLTSFINCINISIEMNMNTIDISRMEYGGNVISKYYGQSKTILSFSDEKEDEKINGSCFQTQIRYSKYTYHNESIIEVTSEVLNDIELDSATFIIICGYGVGSKSNVKQIIQFADKVGAIVCGTKKVIDLGWIPMHLMIGQSGHSIAPDVCLTIGVSGVAPLLNGILKSKKIISINSDPNARIFNYADYGIVGDYKNILNEGMLDI